MPSSRDCVVAVLAGGSGTRFWPLGRASRPKQALPLSGSDPRPLLALTLERLAPLSRTTWIVAPRRLRAVLDAARGEDTSAQWLLEPRPRNTAAAVVLAAERAARDRPGAVLLVVPADHHVAPVGGYRSALRAMVARARDSEGIVTLGLAPDRPATGYGWLHLGPRVSGTDRLPVHRCRGYVEKPSLARATRFLAGGRHLWNGGTFAFRPEPFLEQVRRLLPDVAEPLRRALDRGGAQALARAYAQVTAISIDHGVMERARGVEVVRASIGWDDLGSWDAVGRHRRPDAEGNRLRGEVTALDARDCLVEAADGHVALLGVSDLIVVRTADTVLVARRGEGEAVRRLVERMEREGRGDLLR